MVIDSPHVGGPASAVELPADAQRGGPCVVGTAERCFDATDDNCNGLIDEGCGLNAGEVQLMVAWEGEARVEVDVLDPAREHATFDEATALGLRRDRGCSGDADNCHGQNVENAYVEGAPAPGRYEAIVKLLDPRGARLPVRVLLGGRGRGGTVGADVDLVERGATRAFAVRW